MFDNYETRLIKFYYIIVLPLLKELAHNYL